MQAGRRQTNELSLLVQAGGRKYFVVPESCRSTKTRPECTKLSFNYSNDLDRLSRNSLGFDSHEFVILITRHEPLQCQWLDCWVALKWGLSRTDERGRAPQSFTTTRLASESRKQIERPRSVSRAAEDKQGGVRVRASLFCLGKRVLTGRGLKM